MKQLLLIRHAKSSWDDRTTRDFDRSLNDRGKRDAPMMGQRLRDKNVHLDAIVASAATRAKKTAELIAQGYGGDLRLTFDDDLYLATPAIFIRTITGLDDQLNCVAIVSHNNGITEFANSLCEVTVDDMPTCAIFAIRIDTDDWQLFAEANKSFSFFETPKGI